MINKALLVPKYCDGLAANDLSGFEAFGADVGLVGVAIRHDGEFLDIRLDHAVSDAMRVADVAPGGRMFATDRTDLGHDDSLIQR